MKALLILALLTAVCSAQTYFDPKGPVYRGSYSQRLPTEKQQIKVVSYNVGFSENLNAVVQTLTNTPQLQDADIILLQEIVGEPNTPNNAAQELAARLGLNYVFVPAQIHPDLGKDYGNAILSPWPIGKIKKIILPGRHLRLGTHRAVVGAELTIRNKTLWTYSVHLENLFLDTLSPDEKSRFFQVGTLLAYIPRNQSVIVGGDFNNFNPSGLLYMAGLFWWESFQMASSWAPTKRIIPVGIDHIFSKKLKLADYGTVYDFSASDHAPVWADFASP